MIRLHQWHRANHWEQATPVFAFRNSLCQVPGAPGPERSAYQASGTTARRRQDTVWPGA